jgi:hypothetical protein
VETWANQAAEKHNGMLKRIPRAWKVQRKIHQEYVWIHLRIEPELPRHSWWDYEWVPHQYWAYITSICSSEDEVKEIEGKSAH